MTAEGSAARLLRNTLANGAGVVSGVLVGLVVTPFIIEKVGIDGYGVFALALSLSFLGGYMSLADLGVEAATSRYVAEARARDDAREAQAIVASAVALLTVVALVLAPLLAALSGPLVELFGVDGALRDQAQLCFMFMAVQLLFELPARAFIAVLEGAQRFTVWQGIELSRSVVQAVGFVAVLLAGYGVGALGAVMALSSFLVLLLAAFWSRRVVPGLRVSPRLASRSALRSILVFGGGMMGIRLSATLYRQMDKTIVGASVGVAGVAVYEIANRIQSGAALVQSVAAPVLVPTTAYLREHRETLRDMYLRGTTYATAASVPVITAAFILAEPLIRSWVGEELADAVEPTRLFLVYVVLVSILAVGVTMVIALGRLRAVTVIAAANLLINLVLSLVLVGPFGVSGVIAGTVLAQTIAFFPMQRLLMREFEVGVGEWLRSVFPPLVPGLLAQLVVTYPVLLLARQTDRFLPVAALFVLMVTISYAACYRLGLRAGQRREVRDMAAAATGIKRGPTPAQEEAMATAPGPELIPDAALSTETASLGRRAEESETRRKVP